jgi:hypothetical protein
MIRRRRGRVLAMGTALFIVACSTMPVTTQLGSVEDVVIGRSTLGLNVTVRTDEEIRWINERDGAIQIVFLDSLEGKVNCKRGFGLMNVVNAAMLKSQESVSLCFSEPGSLRYTVRLDRAMSTGWLNIIGRVVVERKTDAR